METDAQTIKKLAESAGRKMKVRKLRGMPGMDEVAVALNARLTYDEEREAEAWVRAVLEDL